MVTIFIDTNVLVPDPFFKGEFASLLLKLAKEGKVELLIPVIVFDELKNRFEISVKEDYNSLKKHASSLTKITGKEFAHDELELNNHLKRFNDFYEYQFEKKHLSQILYSNDILPELVHRSIKRIKPFSPKKEEFRDGIIWLTIVDYMKEYDDKDCFFVSNNVAEFYDTDKKSLHPDLSKDCDRILLHKSFKELIIKEKELFRLKEIHDFERWLESENIDRTYIEEVIRGYMWSSIKSELTSKIQTLDISKIYKSDIIGYLKPTLIKEDIVIENFEIIPIEKFALATIKIKTFFFSKVYKPDPLEPIFSDQGTEKFMLEAELSMTLDMGSQLSLGELEETKVTLA